jgi:hypothetical protein
MQLQRHSPLQCARRPCLPAAGVHRRVVCRRVAAVAAPEGQQTQQQAQVLTQPKGYKDALLLQCKALQLCESVGDGAQQILVLLVCNASGVFTCAAFGWDSCEKGGTWLKTLQGKVPDIKVRQDLVHRVRSGVRAACRELLVPDLPSGSAVKQTAALTFAALFSAGPHMHTSMAPTTKPISVAPGETCHSHTIAPQAISSTYDVYRQANWNEHSCGCAAHLFR